MGSGGKKTVKKDQKPKKTEKSEEKKTFFCVAILGNFQTKMFISETTSFHYFSPRIPISKNIGHPTSGSGGTKTVKKDQKPKKTEKSEEKNFFCAAILDNFLTKMFISETKSFHYCSPRIPNL